MYKIILNLIDLDVDMFFTFNRTRGHMYKLFPVCTRVDVYKYFFSNRVVEPWNSLPAEPHHFSTLSAFKTNFFEKCRFAKVCTTVVSLRFMLLRISILSCRFCRCL